MSTKCLFCGHKNRAGILFCEDCGRGLFSKTNELTIKTNDRFRKRMDEVLDKTHPLDTDTKINSIMLYFRDADNPLVITSPSESTFGRRIDPEIASPDFDLTPFGALEKGVSRVHAAIYCTQKQATITDMKSTNGVFLNGNPIAPNQHHNLRDGDEIQFGRLTAHVYFE